MCGIAGIIGAPNKLETVKIMTRVMALRGPDAEDFSEHKGLALGHRRLSIIDLEGGSQPMFAEREGRKHAIVFNGEIYNYRELNRLLRSQQVAIASNSDTAALLHTLMEHPLEHALRALRGMFAFAWWNACAHELVLARDRLGIKPLYYHLSSDGVLTFASSLEAITANRDIPLMLDSEALEYLLTTGYPPAPLTLYRGIFELPPAHYLVWKNGAARVQAYWSIDWGRKFQGRENEALEQLNHLFNESISDHLVSDV